MSELDAGVTTTKYSVFGIPNVPRATVAVQHHLFAYLQTAQPDNITLSFVLSISEMVYVSVETILPVVKLLFY